MGLLDDLKKQADDLKAKDVDRTESMRSTAVAVFAGDWAVGQLWLFWMAPIAGALLGAALYRVIGAQAPVSEPVDAPAYGHVERRQRQVRGSAGGGGSGREQGQHLRPGT